MDKNIRVPIYIESRYKVNRKKVKEAVIKVLTEEEVKGPVEISIAVVGDRKMKALNKKYRNIDKTTNVLSFSQLDPNSIESKRKQSVSPEEDALMLGDVVISYSQVILEASRENMLVDEKISELIAHGVRHLLGLHHE